jgi:SNF2 family DNA or RNA helicase/uncharacterized Zn finger protein
MARKTYGTTIWGAAFLKAIERETDSGRLSRGKSYANTGKVYDIKLQDKRIAAKVRGNYQPFYQTALNFTPFVKGDKQFIIDHINENPLILAQIMNAKLSCELLDFLKKNEINLYHGFDMQCTCPDFYGNYACKHIAGLYFVLVNEIDKNPFILFSLRGLDLIKHYNIQKDLEISYPIKIDYKAKENALIQVENSDLDFTLLQLPNQKNFILSILEPNPQFAPIDYREVLEEFYKKTAKELPLVISAVHNEDITIIQRVLQEAEISIELFKDITGSNFQVTSNLFHLNDVSKAFKPYIETHTKSSVTISPTQLFTLFISFEDDKGSDIYRYLFYLYRVAYILVQSSAFIPSVYEERDFFKIFYKPIFSLEIIKEQLKYLSNIAPSLATFEKKELTQLSQTQLLLTVILSDIVPHFQFMHKKLKNNPPLISSSFFQEKIYEVTCFEEKNLAQSINNYFAVFEIIQSEYKYKLFIEKDEQSNKYALLFQVEEQKSQTHYLLRDAIKHFNKMHILRFVSFLQVFLPEIALLLQKEKILLSQEILEEFLLRSATIISNLGVDVILPKELKNLLKPKLSLKVTKGSKSLQSFFSLDGILEYDWQIAIGDTFVSVSEFEKLLANAGELIAFKDNFVVISPEEAKALFAQINRKTKLNKFDILQAKLSGDAEFDIDLENFFEEILSVRSITPPESLQANLREYQQRGFEWNINNLLNGFGTILADDMGLGKTIQAITTLLYLKENGYIKKRIVVVVPTSLLSNWENEIEKFAPTLSYFSYYGTKRTLQESDILLTSYDIARRDSDILKKIGIDCLIIDEAQKIKNSDTTIAKTLKSFKAKYKIALSGTPVENNLSELWSLFDFTLPKYLKSLKDFTKNYAQDIEINKDRQKIKKLKQITAPFMLRRLKTDKSIINDLPDKIVVDEYATMTKEQASLYKSVVNESMKRLDEGDAKGLIFKLIISLKQICNHPRNFDKKSPLKKELSGKSELLLTLLDTILQKDEKVLIFTQYVEMGNILTKLIQEELYTEPLYLKGDMSKKQREDTVEKFQTDNRYKIFILSLKAGGTGLNLTAANHVIHYDLWFNPAVENQATDRAFRIGQTKKVTVHRFITKNSFEEKIDKMIQAKKELSDLSVNIGESWLKNMDTEEIKSLFNG